MADSFNFTKASLTAITAKHSGERAQFRDSRQSGLIAEIRPGRSVLTFYFYKRVAGRPARIRIGKFPETSVEQARNAVKQLVGQVAGGEDVVTKRRAARKEHTLKGLSEHWIETHAKPHKKSWREDQRQIDQHLSHLKNRRLSTISKSEVQQLHADIGKKHGHYAANRCIALLRSMYAKADEIGYGERNPATGIKAFAEKSRDRFLLPEELPKFFSALEAEPQIFQDYFLTLLFTGGRRSNVGAMRWNDLQLNAHNWRIPDTKSGQPVNIFLPEPAVEILRRREKEATSVFVFPSRSKQGHLIEPKSSWKRIVDRAKLADLRVHDLRRTLGSFQAIAGASLLIIGKSLGHKSTASTAVYSRLTSEPVENSVAAAVKLIEQHVSTPATKGRSNGKTKK